VAKSGFEILLESLPDNDELEFKGSARKVVQELAEKVPKLKESVLAQSDYSRNMDALREKVKLADSWDEWRRDNWNEEFKMTAGELKKQTELDQLAAELEAARTAALATGEEMTFDQLNQRLEQFTKEKKYVTPDVLESQFRGKTKEVEDYVKGYSAPIAKAAIDIPYLMAKHEKEFGEILDPDVIVKYGVEKQNFNLRDLYEKDWVVEKRQAAMKANYEAEIQKVRDGEAAKIQAAREEAAAEAKKQQIMGQPNGNPVDMGGNDLGPLQRRMTPEPQGDGEPKAPEVPIGEGGLAAFAARQFLAKQAGRTA
jgi:hypothetical protein